MRCRACNTELTDYESTRTDDHGEFFDLCSDCLTEVKISLYEQEDTIGDLVQGIIVEKRQE